MPLKFTAILPTEPVSSIIKNFFSIEFDKDEIRSDYLLPDGLPSFFFIQSSDPVNTYFDKNGHTFPLHEGFYLGYSNTIVTVTHKRLKVFGASVFPACFSMLFGKSPSDIINKFVRLEDERAPLKAVRTLLTSPVDSLASVIELLEKQILEQLNKHQLNRDFLLVCEKIISPGGYRLTVKELAAHLGYSTRYLHSRFAAHFGMPPKKFISLVRFNRALKYIYDNEGFANLSSIAHATGYHDQSHLIRDFKAISGKTPKEIAVHSGSLANKFCLF